MTPDPESSHLRSLLRGLWLPLITPFCDGVVDEASLRRLVRHYAGLPIDGLILAATSGEGLTLGLAELEWIVAVTRETIGEGRRYLPICLGLAGSHTRKMCHTLDETAGWPIDGYLISSPYYSRPSQRGLVQHFTTLAATPPGRSCFTTFLTARGSLSRPRRCLSLQATPTSQA